MFYTIFAALLLNIIILSHSNLNLIFVYTIMLALFLNCGGRGATNFFYNLKEDIFHMEDLIKKNMDVYEKKIIFLKTILKIFM